MRQTLIVSALVLGFLNFSSSAQQATLDIYWIDVEGGAATLIVTPEREAVLMDAGWDREDARDANRIQAAMRDARIDEIDYFIASHFHGDHVGGLPALATRVPIREFVDHGDSVELDRERSIPAWEAYLSVAEGKRRTVAPGDGLPLSGLEFNFVVSKHEILQRPAQSDGPNPHCAGTSAGEDVPGENSSSVGYMLALGDFQFVNLGDLTVDVQHALACPQNLLGAIDVLQVPHHGNGVAPQLTLALAPTVAVLNNGARKGGSAEGYEAISSITGIKGIWQLHRALDTDDAHNTMERMTANMTEESDAGFWIKAVVQADGSAYEVVNGRNGFNETYTAK